MAKWSQPKNNKPALNTKLRILPVAIEIYLALIAALLLQLYSGRRPNRRMMELIQLYLLGVASSQDLQAGWQRELLRLQKRKAPQG